MNDRNFASTNSDKFHVVVKYCGGWGASDRNRKLLQGKQVCPIFACGYPGSYENV